MTIEHIATALAPELILLVGACFVLMLGVTGSPPRGRWVSFASFATIVLALIAAVRVGSPEAGELLPGLWITSLTIYTRWVALSVGALIVLVNWHQPVVSERGEYMAMILLSLLGVLLTASANDLVVLFLAIELVSVPTYVLIALSRDDTRSSEAAVKYFFLGALSAAILAYGMSFLYGAAGTTTIHTFTNGIVSSNFSFGGAGQAQAMIGTMLVFGGLAFKIAAVPFHVYAADVYEGAASPVTGMLGFVPKLAGFVALCKLMSAFGWNIPPELSWMIWIVAAVTMTVGNVLALLQKNVKRMLAYSSIAHTGYMLVALLVGPVAGEGPMRDGVAAMLFYMAVYGVMNLGVFALLTAFRTGGRDVETLDDLSGIARRAPAGALALAICVFSLMGFPPTAGFIGKLYIFSGAFSTSAAHPMHDAMIALAIIGVINSAIAAAYYLRIVAAVYMRTEKDEAIPTGGMPVRWGLALCTIPLLVVFAWPAALTRSATDAVAVVQQSIFRNSEAVATTDPPSSARTPTLRAPTTDHDDTLEP